MTVAEKISEEIIKMPEGNTFKYQELNIGRDEYTAATKAIERLIKKGIIKRASTGLFYKPQKTIFGFLNPDEQDLLRPYLFEGKKRIAYITGGALYNRLGLTTQVPRNIKIASRDKRIEISIGSMKVRSVKSYAEIDDENHQILEVLDALKDFKSIPDIDKVGAVKNLAKRIGEIEDQKTLIKLILRYPPRVRAFAGALLEWSGKSEELNILKNSLNPLSAFEIGLSIQQLPTIKNWSIN